MVEVLGWDQREGDRTVNVVVWDGDESIFEESFSFFLQDGDVDVLDLFLECVAGVPLPTGERSMDGNSGKNPDWISGVVLTCPSKYIEYS